MEDWSCVLPQWVEVELGARVAVGLLQHWEGEVAEVGGEDGLAAVRQHHPQSGQLGKGKDRGEGGELVAQAAIVEVDQEAFLAGESIFGCQGFALSRINSRHCGRWDAISNGFVQHGRYCKLWLHIIVTENLFLFSNMIGFHVILHAL